MSEKLNQHYSSKEERLNIITHAFGLLLSVIGLPFLILKAYSFDGFWKPASLVIYGLSLIILYAASTLYHAAKDPKRRRKLNIFDHAAIYVLIAGTYSPYTIIFMDSTMGWTVFGLTWTFALMGIILKLFYTGRFDKLSTTLYLLMGWQVVFVIKTLMELLSPEGLQLLFAGGVFYTIGALLYSINRIPYNHAIFHVCVLLGSLCHFFSVFSFL
jgi:hemolysin III